MIALLRAVSECAATIEPQSRGRLTPGRARHQAERGVLGP